MISTEYIAYRIGTSTAVLACVSVLTFGMMYLTPGDPARAILYHQTGQQPSADAVASFRAEHGFDDPFPIRYWHWIIDVFQGDLGESYRTGRPVATMIVDALPATLELAFASMAVALVIAIPTGVASAVYRGTWIDQASQLFALAGVSMPNFWLGYLLIIVFALHLGLAPVSGTGGLSHLILPAIALGTGMAAIVTRLVRTSMLDVLDAEYVDAARSKGVIERIVVYKHALRNALIPVVTVVGLQFGFVLNGAVVIEIVFQRPGLGMMLVDAIFARDFPVIQGVVLVVAVLFVVTNLLVDLSYRVIDPRVQLGGEHA
ncbi:nickel ABC transporter permease [Natrialbaceae archaeon A-arb3/5]